MNIKSAKVVSVIVGLLGINTKILKNLVNKLGVFISTVLLQKTMLIL